MVIMNDLEEPMLSYYVLYYEKFRKVMQRTEKEALIVYLISVVNMQYVIYLQQNWHCTDVSVVKPPTFITVYSHLYTHETSFFIISALCGGVMMN